MAFLVAIMGYVLIGTPLVPFHPDEAMQIYASGDYEIATGPGGPWKLTTLPPYVIDSDSYLRILNGTVHRYLVGGFRQLAGISPDRLPPRPGWNWALDFLGNAASGYLPSGELLMLGRLSSSLLLALCAIPAFLLGWVTARRPGAWLFTALFLLNPAVLLNGRRAMQEGSMLLFGLITILVAFAMLNPISAGRRPPVFLWIALALSGGLALASKHIALVFVVCASVIVLTAAVTARGHGTLQPSLVGLFSSLAGAGLLFILLSPALWNQPWFRLFDLLSVRAELIRLLDDGRHGGVIDCATRVLTMPFVFPAQYFELADWASTPGVFEGIRRYEASGLGGIPTGGLLGWIATCLAGIGAWAAFFLRGDLPWSRTAGIGVAVWWGATALLLFSSALPWQRYYLPLIPPTAMLAVLGVLALLHLSKALMSNPSAEKTRAAGRVTKRG